MFGSGDPNADVMFVGEGPGQREDEQGLPVRREVGPAPRTASGRNRSHQGGGVHRQCRQVPSPGQPGPSSRRDRRLQARILRTQLELIDPAVVVTLGNFASKLLLRTETGITRLRGTAYEWWGRFLVPTFHPAAALRGKRQSARRDAIRFRASSRCGRGAAGIDPRARDAGASAGRSRTKQGRSLHRWTCFA